MSPARARARIAALGLATCATSAACAPSPPDLGPFADEVVAAPGASGTGAGDPARATNGVRGGGPSTGSLDVYSLGYDERTSLVLRFSRGPVLDGPGPDLVVFENPFVIAGSDAHFMDPVIVEVSADGARWLAFPHDYVAGDETIYEPFPSAWEGFAGITPVALHVDRGAIAPLSPEAGGDAFDLATLSGTNEDERALASALRTDGIWYVRLTSAAIVTNPDTGVPYPRDPVSDGADIDGVAARLSAEPR